MKPCHSPAGTNLFAWFMRIGLLAVATLGLAACDNNMDDLRERIAKVKQEKAPDVRPLPEIRPYETFEYQPDGRRNPFALPREVAEEQETSSGPQPDTNRRKEPLEAYSLDSLTMVGTFEASDGRFALVEAPDGVVHRVREGSYIGRNYGQVVAVSEGSIDLVELVSNGSGGWIERDASLALDE